MKFLYDPLREDSSRGIHMNGIVLIVVSLIGFTVVLVGLGLIAIKMGVPLSALVGEDGDK